MRQRDVVIVIVTAIVSVNITYWVLGIIRSKREKPPEFKSTETVIAEESSAPPCAGVPFPWPELTATAVGRHFVQFEGTHAGKVEFDLTITDVMTAETATRKTYIDPESCLKAKSQKMGIVVIEIEISNPHATTFQCPGEKYILVSSDGRRSQAVSASKAFDFCGNMDVGVKLRLPLIYRLPLDFTPKALFYDNPFFSQQLPLK